MKKLLQSSTILAGLLFLPSLAHATGLEDCSPLQNGYIRDGFTPACGQLLKVNPDGSLNVTSTFSPSGTQDVNLKQVGGVTTAVGSGVLGAGTQRVVLATDQPAVPVSESGTWTVQPGNTANTTPWLASINDGSNTASVAASGTDAASNALAGLRTYTRNLTYNGSTWDMQRGDTTGGIWVQGPASTGSAVTGKPVLVGGSDGTNARSIATNTSGQLILGAPASSLPVTGSISSGSADSGGPLKIGCVNNTTLPTVTTGQRVDCQADVRGNIRVALSDGGGTSLVSAASGAADGLAAASTGIDATSLNRIFNGTTWDRNRTIQGADGTGLGITAIAFAPQSTATGALAPTLTQSGSNGVLKASAGNLYGGTLTLITGQGAGFLMVFNSTTVPADGAVTPQLCLAVGAGPTSVAFDATNGGVPDRYGTGISWAFSTGANCQTKTAATANFARFSFQ